MSLGSAIARWFGKGGDAVPEVVAEVKGAEVASRTDLLNAITLAELLGAQGPLNTQPKKSATDQLNSYVGWVYACVQILSGDVGARPYASWIRSGAKRRDWEEVESHPVLERPNAMQTWPDLAELLAVHLGLAGKAYLYMITDRPGGMPTGLQAIPPSWITGYRLTDAGRLAYWKLQIPGSAERQLDPEDVVLIRWPDPTDPYGGASPIKAFALSYNMDLFARAYTSELLQNRAQPQGILTTEQEINQEQAETYRERWLQRYGQGRTTEGPAVLGKGVTYTKVSLSLADLAFLGLAQLSRDQILGIYRVPASKLGLTEDSNLANSREAANSYSENALMPYLRKIQHSVNVFVAPRLYADTRPSAHPYFEYESPIRRDVAAIETRSRADLQAGAITLNEHRETIGKDPDPNGDVYYLPLGIRIVDEIEPRDPYALSVTPASSVAGAGDDNADASRGLNGDRRLRTAPQTRLTDQGFELSGLQFKAAQATLEGKLKAAARRLFSKESKLIVAALKEGQRSATPVRKTIIDDILKETAREWVGTLEDSDTGALKTGFNLLGNEVPAAYLLDWDLFEEHAARWARDRAGEAIRNIHDTTREEVGKIIADGLEAGDPIDEVAKRVSEQFNEYKGYRSEAIARTETSNALNYGKYAHAKESERRLGVAYLKTWNPVAGELRTREAHRSENIAPAQTIPFDQDFVVGGEAMARPHDERGSAGNVIRCRCVLTLEVVEDE